MGPADPDSGVWRLIGVKSDSDLMLISFVLPKLVAFYADRSCALHGPEIEKILEIILEDMPHFTIDVDLQIENAQMRMEYLSETALFTAEQIYEMSGTTAENLTESDLNRDVNKKIFSVTRGGVHLYPAFQFEDGAPKPIIQEILDILPNEMSCWQIAFWFESINGWLDDAKPKDCLNQKEEVLYAALQIAEPAIG